MPNENEFFYTVKKSYGPEEIKEKGSRFISYLYPAAGSEEAETLVTGLRKKYYDSTHVCFAYRLGNGKEEYFRYSDDGEPSGTAGLPIFNEIKNKNYYNVLTAVVRYFGGTKLGTGGLVRAYSGAAKKVIDTSETITIYIKKEASLDFPYEFTGEIMQVVNRFSLDIIDREYSDKGISMKLEIPIGRVNEVSQTITDISSGKIRLKC
jgi:uncharacterized YigZ family protein